VIQLAVILLAVILLADDRVQMTVGKWHDSVGSWVDDDSSLQENKASKAYSTNSP
jgi:hypothetical protein